MIKIFSLLAALAVLAGIAIAGVTATSRVEAREEPVGCRMVEVALDEGYGVSRTELREVCFR